MKIHFYVALLFWLLFPQVLIAADPIEALIHTESESPDSEISDQIEALPSAFFFGDNTGIKIFSEGTQLNSESWVCKSLALDELVQLSRGDLALARTEVNLSIPRVRKAFEDACLIRPDDILIAVTPGFQTPVTIRRFVVRKDSPDCSSRSPYSLWAEFEEVLDKSPIFFSTNLDLPQGFNSYKEYYDHESVAVDQPMSRLLQGKVNFLEDFEIKAILLESIPAKKLILIHRNATTLEDNDLINEALYSIQDSNLEEVWVERVDTKKGSGHIRPIATLDFNGDGMLDLFLEGDHQTCPYQMILQAGPEGFEPQEVPNEPCGCS